MGLKALVVAALLAMCAHLAYADILWDKAEQGASVEEIAKLYPEGKQADPKDGGSFVSGEELRYEGKDVRAFGQDFGVGFYFREDALQVVNLSRKSKVSKKACEGKFQKAQDGLTAEYGKAERDSNPGSIHSSEWMKGKTKITLIKMAFVENDCSISIVYRYPVKNGDVAVAKAKPDDTCEKIEGLAESIMKARQVGVPMSATMKTVGTSELVRGWVIDAYEKPRFSTEPMIQRAIEDFRNEKSLVCMKAMRN